LSEDSLLNAIRSLFKHKSDKIVNLNMEAFFEGKKIAKEFTDLTVNK
jgi:indolepyruvate ferredoxin oxidoreductase beta subunit